MAMSAFDLIGRKDDDKARKIRATGDRHFRNFEYSEAIESYNASLCYAHPDSSFYAAAFVDRASVYVKMGLIEEAIKSLDYALNCAKKERDIKYLHEKRARYEELLERQSCYKKKKVDGTCKPELSHPALDAVSFASEHIKVNENEQYGRYLTAKKDINPGDVIILEDPYCVVVDKLFIYKKCTRCMRACNFNLIPCQRCSLAMFCDEKCRQEAEELFHNYECPMMGSIISVLCNEGRIPWISLRLLLITLNVFPDLEDLQTLYRETVLTTLRTKFRFDTFDFNKAKAKDFVRYVLNLARKHKEEKEADEISQMATFIINTLLKRSEMKNRVYHYGHHKLLHDLLLRFFYINMANNFALNSFQTFQEKSEFARHENFGTALYPFTSLINHSCVSNLKVKAIGETNTKMMVYAIRPIKTGEQLFITYNKHLSHLHAEKYTRMSQILRELGFRCSCPACCQGYPMADDLETQNIGTEEETEMVRNSFTDLEWNQKISEAQLRLPKCVEAIKKYQDKYPCMEMHQFEALLEYCMSTMYCTKPFLYE